MELEVGQRVRVLPYAYSTGRVRRTGRGLDTNVHEGLVVKVARIRATVRVQGWEVQFSMNDGRECVKDFGRTIETEEMFTEREHRQDVLAKLLDHGITFGRLHQEQELSTGKLEALVAVMEGKDNLCTACGKPVGDVCWRCA